MFILTELLTEFHINYFVCSVTEMVPSKLLFVIRT